MSGSENNSVAVASPDPNLLSSSGASDKKGAFFKQIGMEKASSGSSINNIAAPNSDHDVSKPGSASVNGNGEQDSLDVKEYGHISMVGDDFVERSRSPKSSRKIVSPPDEVIPAVVPEPPKSESAPHTPIQSPPAVSGDPSAEASDKVEVNLQRRTSLGKNWKMGAANLKGLTRTASFKIKRGKSNQPQTINEDSATASTATANGSTGSAKSPSIKSPLSSGSSSTPSTITDEKRKKYVEVRKYIVDELLSTEKNYVSNLTSVIEKFRNPLLKAAQGSGASVVSPPAGGFSFSSNDLSRARGGLERSLSIGHRNGEAKSTIIPLVDIRIIFAHIEDLLEFSEDFCKELDRVGSKWEESEVVWEEVRNNPGTREIPMGIGPLFDKQVRNWDVYLRFIDNYSAAKEALRRSDENSSAYRQFLADSLKDKDFQQKGVAQFLILPVQRVTRYVLLLQDLKKHTPTDHPEYNNISISLEGMRVLANKVNEVKRKEEEMTRMFAVVRSVEDTPPTIISATRRILFETESTDVSKDFMDIAMEQFISDDGSTTYPSVPGAIGTAPMDAQGAPAKIFIFSDLVMIAKPKNKKGKDGFSKYMKNLNLGGEKKVKMALYRMGWFRDVKFYDIPEERTAKGDQKKSRHIIKIVVQNSDGGNQLLRRKFWGEIAAANTAASSAPTKGPRTSSKKARSVGEPVKVQDLMITSQGTDTVGSEPASVPSSPTRPFSADDTPTNTDTAGTSVTENSLPTVESLEKLALKRISMHEGDEVTNGGETKDKDGKSETTEATPEKQVPKMGSVTELDKKQLPAVPALSGGGLKRASTIMTRSPQPRSSSLQSNQPTMSSIIKQVSTEGPSATTDASMTSLQTDTTSVNTTSLNLKDSSTELDGRSVRSQSLGLGGPLTESFILEFAEKRGKNELMLLVGKLENSEEIDDISDPIEI